MGFGASVAAAFFVYLFCFFTPIDFLSANFPILYPSRFYKTACRYGIHLYRQSLAVELRCCHAATSIGNITGAIPPLETRLAGLNDLLFQNLLSAEWAILDSYQ
jgi:hypothetical protein